MSSLRSLVVAVSSTLLFGCAVGPDYHRPGVPLQARYLSQPSAGERAALPVTSLAVWWQGFNDPVMTHLISQALAQNLDLTQAIARVAQTRAGLGTATAALLPSGNISAQAGRARESTETPLGRVLSTTPDYDRYGSRWETNLGASWELDLAGGQRRQRQAALAEYQAAQADVVATRLAVAAQTADLYITVRGLQMRLEIARQQSATQRMLLEKVRLRQREGIAADYQVRQTEGALSQVDATLPVLRNGLETAMNALDVMLATPPGTQRRLLEVPVGLPAIPSMSDTGTPGDLLRRRPDLIVAERRLAASNARIGVAIAEYYPKFSLSALLGSATSLSDGHLFSGPASQSSVGLGLQWRLFDFGRINADIDRARGQEAEAMAAYRQSVLRATEEVENAFSALINREQQARILAQGEASLTQARASSYAAWQNGAASLIDVLQADDTRLQASDGLVMAQTASARAAVAAFLALGGGWQPPASDEAASAATDRAVSHVRIAGDQP